MTEPARPTAALPVVSRRFTSLVNLFFHYNAVALVIVQGILLVPLYLRNIPVATYGAWLATGSILSWIDLVDPGLSDVLRQRVAYTYGKGNVAALSRVIGTGVLLAVAMSTLPLLAWPLGPHVASFVGLHGPASATLAQCFRIGLAGTALTLASYGVASINNGLQLPLAAGLAFTVASLSGIACTVVLLHHGVGLAAIPLGQVFRSLVLFLGNAGRVVVWCAKHLPERPRFARSEFREIAGLSAFTFVSRLGNTLLERMDGPLSAHLLSPAATATLVLTSRAFEPLRAATVAIASALMPGLAHLSGEGHRDRVRAIATDVIRASAWMVGIGVGSIVALNPIFMRLWVGPGLYGGHRLTVAVAMATTFAVFGAVLTRLIYAVGGIRQSSGASLVEALVKLPLQLALMRWLGLVGLPLAASISVFAVSGWYLPSVAARLFDTTRAAQLRLWVGNLLRVGLLVLLGIALRSALITSGLAWTWPRFVFAAAVTGFGFTALAFVDPSLRRMLTQLRARRAPPTAP